MAFANNDKKGMPNVNSKSLPKPKLAKCLMHQLKLWHIHFANCECQCFHHKCSHGKHKGIIALISIGKSAEHAFLNAANSVHDMEACVADGNVEEFVNDCIQKDEGTTLMLPCFSCVWKRKNNLDIFALVILMFYSAHHWNDCQFTNCEMLKASQKVSLVLHSGQSLFGNSNFYSCLTDITSVLNAMK